MIEYKYVLRMRCVQVLEFLLHLVDAHELLGRTIYVPNTLDPLGCHYS